MAMQPWVLCWSDGKDAPTIDCETVEKAHEVAQKWAEAATGNVAVVRTSIADNGVMYVIPAVGQKCALGFGGDRYQYEVSKIAPHGRTIYIKRGEVEIQARKQTDGSFKLWGAGHRGYVGFLRTDDHQDPSF